MTELHPITGRPYGKPGSRIRDRIADVPADTRATFPTPELRAYFFAHAAEAASCWPRVLDGTMKQERFHEHTDRMREAILRSGRAA